MKVIVKENLGAEYASDLISSCNQSGIQAIADYTGNEILFYDPKNWLYGRHSDMMKDASLEDDIFSIFNGKNPELRAKVLKPAKGDDFREFAVEWNNLQKQESPDIIKTKQCDMIRFGAHESRMSRSSMKGEFTVEIEWQVDFPKFGINAGDTEELVLRFSEIDALAHAHGGNGFEELIEEMMNEKYPGIGQLDYEDDYIITNFEEMCDYHDMYIGKERVYEATRSDGSMDDNVSEWYAERFPDDDLAGRINKQVTFQDVMDCIDYGADIYDLLETADSTIRERLFAELAARTGIEYGKLYRKWLKNSAFDESIDNRDEVELGDSDFDQLNEYLEDMAQSYWEEDNMGGGGKAEMLTNLYSDVLQWLNDRGFTKHNHSPITLVVDGAQVPARDLAKEILDGVYRKNKDSYTGYGENTYNESGSNGGTIDVTLKFTNSHYGKKLKEGDERTIKLDTSTAPTIYDTDDMLTWIAEVASDQIPGGGEVTKYDFETIDPPDDVLIKAVLGDEGFGPDVDVDFEDFEPEDVPSEISYGEAVRFYKKMHDAYDDRKLNYTKYDKIRNKLMDAIVKGLLKEKSLDDLAEEWFINYGTMNGWGWKTSFKYNVASALHEIHKKKHPDEHVMDREDTMRGWHSEKCSCGFGSSCDSSD